MIRGTHRWRLGLVAACLPLVATACAVGPDYKRPAVEISPAWVEADKEAAVTRSEGDWWASFGDPLLASLVERACKSAPQIRQATARLREARAMRAGEAGTLFPKVDVDASYSNSRISSHGFLESFGATTGAVFPGQQINLFQSGFDAQWEIDLFGHVRRSIESAGAEAEAMQAAAADVARSLSAETAREVIEVRSFDERLAIAARNVAAQKETLEILADRRRAGVASDTEVARADATLAATEAEIPALRGRRAAGLHRLEALVAAASGTLDADFAAPAGVPQPSALPDPGLPSDLLLHRPDIAAAERELAAATARIGVARAELLPRFSLTGNFGLQSQHIGDLLTTESRFWYIGPGMRWPLFDAGRLRAAMRVADARTEEASARYEGAVRTAIAEVETALAALTQERERETDLEREAKDEALAADATSGLYRSGLTDLLHVLDAERSRYRAEDALAVSRATLAENAIALYKALGGGWKSPT